MKTERLEALVLRRTNYGEADRIVQFITPVGRRSAMARGVRKEKSKLAGGIELFALSDIVFGSGRGELGIVTSARMRSYYSHIVEDYDRLQFAYECIKQVAKASEIVDEPEWFSILLESLQSLNEAAIDIRLIQAWFYLRVAQLLGHELGLQYDSDGKKLTADLLYRYDIGEKGFRPSEHGEVTADHIKLLRLIATKPIRAIAQIGGVDGIMSLCQSISRDHAAVT